MGYHDKTDKILKEKGGEGPPCPDCGKPMLAEDDHGRFTCLCRLFSGRKSIQSEERE